MKYTLFVKKKDGIKEPVQERNSIEELDKWIREHYHSFDDYKRKTPDAIEASIEYTYNKENKSLDVLYGDDNFDPEQIKRDYWKHLLLNKQRLNSFLRNTFLSPHERRQFDQYVKGEEVKKESKFFFLCIKIFYSEVVVPEEVLTIFNSYFKTYKTYRDVYFFLKRWNANSENRQEDAILKSNLGKNGKTIPRYPSEFEQFPVEVSMTDSEMAHFILEKYGFDRLMNLYSLDQLRKLGLIDEFGQLLTSNNNRDLAVPLQQTFDGGEVPHLIGVKQKKPK